MDQTNETIGPELDTGKKKKRVLPKVFGVILIILALFLAAAAFMPGDSAPEEDAPSAFDPYSSTGARQYLEFNMLTDPVATFTLGENHGIYVAFQADNTGLYPYLVCLSQADFDRFSEIYEFTFDGRRVSQAPGIGTVYGYAVEIDSDLEDYTLEYLEQIGMSIPADEFYDYFGGYYLDTTLVKEQNSASVVLLVLAAVLLVLGLVLLLKKDKKAPLAQPVQPIPAEDGSTATTGAQPAWEIPAKSNPALGILGAFLGSLVGAVVWILLYRVGYLVGIAGYLAVFCAIIGYTKLGGGTIGKAGTMLCVLIAVLVMVLSNCVAFSWVIADAVNESTPGRSSITYILSHFPEMMDTLDLWGDFVADLAIGLVLALIAGFSSIAQAFKKRK